jgi:hypothetical protein
MSAPDQGVASETVFAALDQAIAAASSEARPGFVVALAARLAHLGAGMVAPTRDEPAPLATEPSEQLLTPEQAIAAIGGNVSLKWLYRHTKGQRFRRDLSRKVVRFERAGLMRWIATKRA